MAEEKMTNCPMCGKPVLNNAQFLSSAKFNLKCPWCQETLTINVSAKITATSARKIAVKLEQTHKQAPVKIA